MIETKPRPCNGTGKAISVKGCGTETLHRKYGLCRKCLIDFLFETDAGKLLMQRSIIPKAKNMSLLKEKKIVKHIRESLETKSQLESKLQREINTIVRLIDKQTVCISTQKPLNEKYDAGHFFTTKAHPELRFNLFNIYAQSVYANQYLSGDISNFLDGLSNIYGEEHKEYVLSLKTSYKPLKLSKQELQDYIVKARELVKALKKANITYSVEQRKRLRGEYNEYIGIYTLPNPI